MNKFGIMAVTVLAKASSGVTLYLQGVRDFGIQTLTRYTDLSPDDDETYVIKDVDIGFSELRVLQLSFGDDPDEQAAPIGDWEMSQIAMQPRNEETS